MVLGSIKNEIESQETKILGFNSKNIGRGNQGESKFKSQMSKIRDINNELDQMVKESAFIAEKFKRKDSSLQVNQNQRTGELRSNLNFSTIPDDKNDSKSIQASFFDPYTQQQKRKDKSGVSSIVARVPSENPLSNEQRIIMKHEGIQTEQKQSVDERQASNRNEIRRTQSITQVPKLQLPNHDKAESKAQINLGQSMGKFFSQNNQQQNGNQPLLYKTNIPPQSRFANRTPSRLTQNQDHQRNLTQTQISQYSQKSNQISQKPYLVMQDFYRNGSTNINYIQEQLNQRPLLQNQSYQNTFYQRDNNSTHQQIRLNTHSSINQPYLQQSVRIQNQPVNPYHHLRDPNQLTASQMQSQPNQYQDGMIRLNNQISTGRFSVRSMQSINDVDQAMAILLN